MHNKKHYFIYLLFCLFLKSSKAFSVSLRLAFLYWQTHCIFIVSIEDLKDSWNHYYQKQSSWGVRSSRPEVFCKEGAIENFTKFRGNYLCQSLFFSKNCSRKAWNSDAGVFLWILQNFYEHLLYRTPPDDCFCMSLAKNWCWMILCVEHPLFSLQRTTGETKTRVYLKISKNTVFSFL